MALFFKNGEELYRDGTDAIGRKEFATAKKKFLDANEKGYGNDGLALVYAGIIDVGTDRGNLAAYQVLLERLGALTAGSFKFGLTDIDVADFAVECELAVKEIEAARMEEKDYRNKGNRMIEVAGEYMSRMGEKNLKLDEIFKGTTVATGNREALILQAQGYSILGRGCVSADPKMAADYMQMAYNFRRQLGDSGDEEMKLSKNYARSATCWICGRPAHGQGIHFKPMKADIEPVFQNMTAGDVVKPVSEDYDCIYVCMPCYTSISNRSDEISRGYYESAMAEMRAMELRLNAQISSLRMSVNMRR